jgi:UDP-N-acetylmuramoyl-tripeptide--D-alanyl-D-alanine ligase
MSQWTLDRIRRALRPVDGSGAAPSGTRALGGISTDTRTLAAGDVFVALRGERFDGHDYLGEAVARGAAALVVSSPGRAAGSGVPVFAVRDTQAALGALGTFWRSTWGGTVVAIAGSNGKTTTRELTRAALAGSLDVHATRGNLNNQVGVPLTLLAIPASASIAVVEVGTSLPGEVDTLRRVVQPDVAVVTSVGEEHLEGLGSIEGVLREETSIYRDVPNAIAPSVQPEIARAARSLARQVTEAGLDDGDVRPDAWGIDGSGCGWATLASGARLQLRIAGTHNLRNAMLALAVARACGVPDENAAAGMSAVDPLDMRGQWLAAGGLTIVHDAYNANPASMREAIAVMDALDSARPKVLVLGTMRELGVQSAALHDAVAERALASGASLVAGIGEFATALDRAATGRDRVLTAPDVPELWTALAPRLPANAMVLLKASRGVRLERLVPLLTEWAGGPD